MTYVDPTDNAGGDNGKIFVGAAFPTLVKEAKAVLFPEKEKKELRGGADGHVLAISEYEPGADFTYYWGAAWSKADIKDSAALECVYGRFCTEGSQSADGYSEIRVLPEAAYSPFLSLPFVLYSLSARYIWPSSRHCL